LLRSRQRRYDEAIILATASRDALKAHPSKVVRATSAATLGRVLLSAGRPGDAAAELREADRLFTERQKTMTPDHAEVQSALAQAAAAQRSP
jgi:hypothetical protein